MEEQLKQLPLNPRVADTALMVHQSEVPNQEVHMRTKRLVANKPRFEVVVYDDEPDVQAIGQDLEDGIKATYKWVNRGKVSFDWKVTQFQQGYGLGMGKLVWVPGHGDVLSAYDVDQIGTADEDGSISGAKERNGARAAYRSALGKLPTSEDGREATAYDQVTEKALHKELPPVRFVAVNPVHCYWFEDDDGIEVIAETSDKLLNPLLTALHSYGLRFDESKSRLYEEETGSDAVGAGGAKSLSSPDMALRCRYTEIRTRNEIAIMIEHPKIAEKTKGRSARTGRGAAEEDKGVVLRFDNPFGPYTTGYVLVPGDVTTEDCEEDKYQPPVLAAINSAQALNVLSTAQLSAALEEAFAPPYTAVKPEQMEPPSGERKAPEQREGEIPMVPGEIKRVEAPAADLERVADRLIDEEAPYRFREVLGGDATSDSSGHKLALQVAQADIQMVPYQNTRADAIKEMMMGVLYAVRRHGLNVYIPTLPGGERRGDKGGLRVQKRARLTPEMADLDFDLIVTLGAETPTTRYAKLAALREQEEAGIVGYQTVVEQSGAENPEDEIARVFEGKALKAVMEENIPRLSEMISAAVQARLDAFLNPPPPIAPTGATNGITTIDPESGFAGGGGAQPATMIDLAGRVPGVGMPPVPYTSEFGPSIPEGGGDQQVPVR